MAVRTILHSASLYFSCFMIKYSQMIYDEIKAKLNQALEKSGIKLDRVDLTHPTNINFGDYSTNVAFQGSKTLGKNPYETAQIIASHIDKGDLIEKVEVIKPGFINLWISKDRLLSELNSILEQKERYGHTNKLKNKKVMVEFTDPNPFKEFHIGHLYSNIVGESLARLMSAIGTQVKRANYQGDVGIHVAKSIWGLKKKMSNDNISLDDLFNRTLPERVNYMGQAYALGSKEFDKKENVKQEIKTLNKEIYELNDTELRKLYETGRKWSLDYFETIYARLGTKFDFYFFEREVGKEGLRIVKENMNVFTQSEGAIIFKGEDYGLHTRVFVNSLGLPTYETKDLALPSMKYEKFPFDLSISVTGNEINEYFKVVLKVLELISPSIREKTKHLSHGMVRLPEGKMSSRKGNVLTGEWLLDEAKKEIIPVLEKSDRIKKDQLSEVSEKVSIAAVKYSLLKSNIGKDAIFNFQESLSFEGNSGPYLQYTYARCRSVLTAFDEKINNLNNLVNLNKEEEDILRTVSTFPDIVTNAAINYSPSLLSTYLFELAQKFNLFYQKHSILKADDITRNMRLKLTEAVSQILKNGLFLLGIETVEKM